MFGKQDIILNQSFDEQEKLKQHHFSVRSIFRSKSLRRFYLQIVSMFTPTNSDDINKNSSCDLNSSFVSFEMWDDESEWESFPECIDEMPLIDSNSSETKLSENQASLLGGGNEPVSLNVDLFLENLSSISNFNAPSIFVIPELVFKIIEFASEKNGTYSTEGSVFIHAPSSFNHVLLLFEDTTSAKNDMMPYPKLFDGYRIGVLYTCLSVNKLFYRIAKQILRSNIFFNSEMSFYRFVRNKDPNFFSHFCPTTFKLNNLFFAKQFAMEKIAQHVDFSMLKWLEIQICPVITPHKSMLHSSLRSLIVTGSNAVDDTFLVEVSQKCPNLEVLDLRGSERITDWGIYRLSASCSKLLSFNLGRKGQGYLITDHGVSSLVRNNKQLHTVGLAGCHITDCTIWELALNAGQTLRRLSLNDCPYITNESLPVILDFDLLPNLFVLEIRRLFKITHLDSLMTFQRTQEFMGNSVSIGMCPELMARWEECKQKKESDAIAEIYSQEIFSWSSDEEEAKTNNAW